ncbi:septal ring lytic transglycosylase RlpA family protein [Erythrobacter jejuensis]|uniref:Endolytic peptidoglycan transglycosylase RlpA n=2 Tax=Parerythrobacter jejuensis TaxID=795812 RepID=A0A845AW01_9SPHN|nr:septal ring lytic transglycosylase RlpA family protein [Parerythrobacter jejuensis]
MTAEGISEAEFESSFERFDALPAIPEPSGNVVDLDSFEPPIEVEKESVADISGRSLGFGVASYYGRRFHGRRTANGERFDMNALTAAHKTLPFGSRVRVTNPRNGKSVVVRINDRGPFIRGRTIDLSRNAAQKLGIIQRGHGRVELELLK